MKQVVIWIALALLLCACASKQAMETIADEWAEPAAAVPREMILELPGEATVFAMESDTGRQYLGDGYEIAVQTLTAGDLNRTMQTLTGFTREELTVMETGDSTLRRYEFAWASEGEAGDRVGRGAVLDDGNFHYCLTVLQDVEAMETCQIIWSEVFHYFDLA